MTIGTSIFLIATGAILRFAVADGIEGIDLSTAGLILMIVGVAGLVISMMYANLWARDRGGVVVERDRPVVRERDVY